MKRLLPIAILVSLLTLHSSAQRTNSISLSLGPAFPVGEFANHDGYSAKSGLAQPGALADLSFMHKIRNSNFGLTASLRARINNISSNAVLAPFEAQFPGYTWSVKKDPWEAGAAMIGAYQHFPVAKKIDLEEALEFGAATAVLPENIITGTKSAGVGQPITNYFQATTKKKNAAAFTALLKVGGTYALTPKLSLISQLDWWYLNPKFKNVTQSVTQAQGFIVPGVYTLSNATSISYATQTINYTQNMSSLNFTVGLSLHL